MIFELWNFTNNSYSIILRTHFYVSDDFWKFSWRYMSRESLLHFLNFRISSLINISFRILPTKNINLIINFDIFNLFYHDSLSSNVRNPHFLHLSEHEIWWRAKWAESNSFRHRSHGTFFFLPHTFRCFFNVMAFFLGLWHTGQFIYFFSLNRHEFRECVTIFDFFVNFSSHPFALFIHSIFLFGFSILWKNELFQFFDSKQKVQIVKISDDSSVW